MTKMLTGYKKPVPIPDRGMFMNWLTARGYTAATALTYSYQCTRFAGPSHKIARKLYAEYQTDLAHKRWVAECSRL